MVRSEAEDAAPLASVERSPLSPRSSMPPSVAMWGHRKDIDGLRALAVLAVVLFHYGATSLSGGYVGVDVFFVISGFLITLIVSREIHAKSFSILTFYERRVRRIFPALLAVFIVTSVACYALFLPEQLLDFGKSLVSATLFASNVFFYRGAGYFEAPSELKPLLHTWSLAVEEQFYIAFPVYLMVGYKLARGRLVAWTVPIFLGSLALSVLATLFDSKAGFFLPLSRAHELMLGSLLALGAFPALRTRRTRDVVSVLGLGLVLWSIFRYSADTPFPGYAALVPCVGAAMIIHAGSNGPSAVGRLLSLRPCVSIGLISYSLYLWHWPLLVLCHYYLVRDLSLAESLGLLALSLAISAASWRFIEAPFRARGALLNRRALFAVATATMGAFVAFGVWITIRHGAASRFSPALQEVTAPAAWNGAVCSEHPTLHTADPKACVIGNEAAATPSFVVWGDSHARALMPVIDHVAREKGRVGLAFVGDGCAPITDVRVDFGRSGADSEVCAESARRAYRAIVEGPTIEDVIVVARWPFYASGEGYGADRSYHVRVRSTESGKPLDERQIEDSAARTLQQLLASGKKVHLVETAPEFRFRAPDSLGRLLLWGRDVGILDEPEAALEIRGKLVHRLEKRFSSEPNFQFVPTHDLFCTHGICRSHAGPHVLYSDNNHLGPNANALLAARVATMFR